MSGASGEQSQTLILGLELSSQVEYNYTISYLTLVCRIYKKIMVYTVLCVLIMFVRVGCSSSDGTRLAYYDFIILDMLAMHHIYPAFIFSLTVQF